MDNLTFDAKVFRLGKLCPRGHDWNGTGQSLRYKCDGKCPVCRRKYPEGRPKNPNRKKEYYQEHAEEIKARVKRWKQENAERTREWYRQYSLKNRDRLGASALEKYHKNPKAAAERQRRYLKSKKGKRTCKVRYERNKERIKEIRRRYQASPKGKVIRAAAVRRRQARKAYNHSFPYSFEQLENLKSLFDYRCAYCGKSGELTVDHFIPVSKRGPDCLGNLAPACLSCNSSKCDLNAQEWYERQPFYSQKRWQKILRVLGRTATNGQLPLF
jgi:hypothetical protein